MAQTLLDWLTKRYPTAKRQTLKRMVEAGRVSVNARRARTLKDPLAEGDAVAVDERPAARVPVMPAGLRIVFEDADILVVDKPTGLLTSTTPRELRPTLLAKVREYVLANEPRARVGLIHRLDRDASGLLIFSKSDLAYQSLKTQFYQHTVRREYTAVVHGTPQASKGRIESNLVERTDGSVHSTRQIGKGEAAITQYEVLKSAGGLSLLRVNLKTGRKHQIRVHLSERSTPIVGDSVYGNEKKLAPRLMLAATRLVIQHPRDGKEMAFEIPMPGEFGAWDVSLKRGTET
ncbi:MAG: RluA family pseudouridine synthase [Phycisphaerales bacterium]|nr:RluA family pseudouridine synthase [Phycisphaerales bacterium]